MPINPNESHQNRHTLAIGKSGSGKTYFLQNHPWVKPAKRLIVWDPYESHKVNYAKSLKQFGLNLAGAIKSGKTFRLGLSVNPTLSNFEQFCCMVWAAADGNNEMIVMVEELADVAKAGKASPFWGKMVRIGRKYGLIVMPATQRPQEVDKTIFTQVSRIWVGLVSPYDQESVEKSTGLERGSLKGIKPESFEHYYIHGADIQRGGPGKKLKI